MTRKDTPMTPPSPLTEADRDRLFRLLPRAVAAADRQERARQLWARAHRAHRRMRSWETQHQHETAIFSLNGRKSS